MIGLVAASSAAALSLAPTPAAPSVPTQFQGDWRVRLDECPPAITDRPVWINDRRIRMDHSVGEVRPIHQGDRHNIILRGELLSEGDPRTATLKLKLSESESELTLSEDDWTVTLQRCPAENSASNGAAK